MHATFVTVWLQVMQPLANVHETKWTPHVKRASDVAVANARGSDLSLKAPLHDTIRPQGACRLPCTWVNRNV